MPNTISAATPPRPLALTTVFFEAVDEKGYIGFYGRSYIYLIPHPYPFVSREAAGRFAAAMCDRHGYDGYRLRTPGHVPPPRPVLDECEIPY